ncbi:unnamed protein product [Coffea canephora]|uniref:Uncharacterized protein n=1 Tax=Coffea canephora TaxID=49390 RepID=A0A068UAB0_COFCA|nr:unnamed protein product [Coffea canephora]
MASKKWLLGLRISQVDKSAFDWTVLVQVIEADCVKIARDGDLPRFLHRFAFGDLQGIKISAVVFDDDIAIVHGRLLPFRKYYISNAEMSWKLLSMRCLHGTCILKEVRDMELWKGLDYSGPEVSWVKTCFSFEHILQKIGMCLVSNVFE